MISSILKADLLEIASCEYIPYEKFKDSTIMVTGATGLMGSLIIKALHTIKNELKLNFKIIGLVRDINYAKEIFQGIDIRLVSTDIRMLYECDEKLDYIIHCAAVTKSKEMVSDPINVIEVALDGTQNILKLATLNKIKSMVYLSSMEVYGALEPSTFEAFEDTLGYIDIANVRSCYPESKRMCECMCHCYSTQLELPVKIVRLAQTFGAGTSKEDERVFAQFARNAIKGEDIILHTMGNSYGNYCYSSDAIKAIFLVLLNGENNQVYNVSNEENTVTIKDMAKIVSKTLSGDKSKVVIDIPKNTSSLGYAPVVKLKVMSQKLVKMGWKPRYKLADMYIRMAEDWGEV